MENHTNTARKNIYSVFNKTYYLNFTVDKIIPCYMLEKQVLGDMFHPNIRHFS